MEKRKETRFVSNAEEKMTIQQQPGSKRKRQEAASFEEIEEINQEVEGFSSSSKRRRTTEGPLSFTSAITNAAKTIMSFIWPSKPKESQRADLNSRTENDEDEIK